MSSDFDSIYPQKPTLEEDKLSKGHISMTILSMLLFVLSVVLLFDIDLIFIVELVAVILFHELGHYFYMKRFQYQQVRLLFIPLMGAFVHGTKDEQSQRENLLVNFGGPIPGIIVGCILWMVGDSFQLQWAHQLAILFLSINMFNLLPILPLDGGRVLSVLFLQKIDKIQVVISFVTSMALIGIGYYFSMYMLMGIGLLMGFQVRSLHRKYLIRKGLIDDQVDYFAVYKNLSNRSYHFIKKHILENTPGLRKFIDQVDDNEESDELVAREVKNMLHPPTTMDLSVRMKIGALVLWILSFLVPIVLVINSMNELQ